MTWPPSLLRFRIGVVERGFGLWLPLFLVWPLFIVATLAIVPLVLLLALLLWPTGWSRTSLLMVPWVFRVIYSLRGLVIELKSGTDWVYIPGIYRDPVKGINGSA